MSPRVLQFRALASISVVAAAAAFVFAQLHPDLLLTDTTPAGGDMGAHVWAPWYLKEHLLPEARLTGWTQDWYAGFPALTFYFPLPSLAIALLSFVIPYSIAFKLVSVSGLVALPVAAWAMARLMRLEFPAPALFAVATLPFIFDRYFTIWGGNAASTLAGEFSFSIALALALVFLGVVWRGLEEPTGRLRWIALALLAAIALSHLLPTMFAVVGSVLLLIAKPSWRGFRWLLSAGLLGTAAVGFWLVPFAARLGYSNDMGWERTDKYRENLLPWLRDDVADSTTRHLVAVVVLAAISLGFAIARRKRPVLALAALTMVAAVAFRYMPDGALWNARVLPFWYLGLYLLAAYTVAESIGLIAWASEPQPDVDDAAEPRVRSAFAPERGAVHMVVVGVTAVVSVTVLVWIGLPLGTLPSWVPLDTDDHNFVRDWARWNYSGYERKDAFAEYDAVLDLMDDVGRTRGCGRAMWEYEPELNRFGTPMALMLLPYRTDGCIGSMEGLYFESSATVPYHFLNQSELSRRPSRAMRDLPYRELDLQMGVAHLQLLGVRYYMAVSPSAQAQAQGHPDLTLVASRGPFSVQYPADAPDGAGIQQRTWEVYEVAGSDIVEGVSAEPVVLTGVSKTGRGWIDEVAVPFYEDPSGWDVLRAADGPTSWVRVPGAATPRTKRIEPAEVSAIDIDPERISFEVDEVGKPVLVKVSYFPNWRADGADGPWRVAPNLMVVVPTERTVVLEYRATWAEALGWLLSASVLVPGGALLVRRLLLVAESRVRGRSA